MRTKDDCGISLCVAEIWQVWLRFDDVTRAK
jgi:hypothetical protein